MVIIPAKIGAPPLPSMDFDDDFLDTLCLPINSTDDPFDVFNFDNDPFPSKPKHPTDASDGVCCEPPKKRIKTAVVPPDDEKPPVKVHRIACKARGMPDSHNPQNAYLEVPEDCKHGTTLACSHPQCLASGRRFRYCDVCKEPVAKRNFMKRHSHSMVTARPTRLSKLSNEPSVGQADDSLTGDEQIWLQLFHDRPLVADQGLVSEWMNDVLDHIFAMQRKTPAALRIGSTVTNTF